MPNTIAIISESSSWPRQEIQRPINQSITHIDQNN